MRAFLCCSLAIRSQLSCGTLTLVGKWFGGPRGLKLQITVYVFCSTAMIVNSSFKAEMRVATV